MTPYNEHINLFLAKYYNEKHTSKDYRLLKGAYTSKKLKNNELEKLMSGMDYVLNEIDEDNDLRQLRFSSEKSDINHNDENISRMRYENLRKEMKRYNSGHSSLKLKSQK